MRKMVPCTRPGENPLTTMNGLSGARVSTFMEAFVSIFTHARPTRRGANVSPLPYHSESISPMNRFTRVRRALVVGVVAAVATLSMTQVANAAPDKPKVPEEIMVDQVPGRRWRPGRCRRCARRGGFATDTRIGQHAHLDARHRVHARVEDRIRTGRDTGLGRMPSRSFHINAAWLTATMIAVDLLAVAQTILLHDTDLARVEPKTLRYRLLHVAARLTRGQRRVWLRIDQPLALGPTPRRSLHPTRRPADSGQLTNLHRPHDTRSDRRHGKPARAQPGEKPSRARTTA